MAAKALRPVAVSLLGTPCYPQPLPARYRLYGRLVLAEARARFRKDPCERYTIWYARLLAYANEFEAAFEVLDDGLRRYPESFRLHRHRGHRCISTYRLADAVADFDEAARLVEGKPTEWEEDGIRHRLPIPPERTQWQVYYHQNVAKYLNRDYEGALAAVRRCAPYNENADDLVASSAWLHCNLLRLGRRDEARAVLETIDPGLPAKESRMYLNRLLVYKGLLAPEDLLKPVSGVSAYESQITGVTLRYGLALYYNLNGDKERARREYEALLAESGQWSAFAHIAAEVDLLELTGARPVRAGIAR